MDKILSARVHESTIQRIGSLARRLNTSKKRIIEDAVKNFADKIDHEEKFDIFEQTCGVWLRNESAGRIVEGSRKTFRKSMLSHRK